MKVLVINTGSSSIKYQLIDMSNESNIAAGLVEKIGEAQGRIKHKRFINGQEEETVKVLPIENHQVGLDNVAALLTDPKVGVIKDKKEVDAVGHRAVHGGEKFNHSVKIDNNVIQAIKDCVPLAPLHNPANIVGIEVATKIFDHAPQVAVFDTAFHQTMPEEAYRYALPEKLYKENGVRRYGFHGTSHLYVSHAAAKFLGKKIEDFNAITIHIGNGASMAAIKHGKSIDTSMGLTPLEGLIMGTRSGDMDPAIPYFLQSNLKMTFEEVNQMLNKESGMKGITGKNDLRDIEDAYEKEHCPIATRALEMYAYRIRKYIGAYYAAIAAPLDAIIFTAGVGENSPIIRNMVCKELSCFGIELDESKNAPRSKEIRDISSPNAKIKTLVVPTNEELEIARQTKEVIG